MRFPRLLRWPAAALGSALVAFLAGYLLTAGGGFSGPPLPPEPAVPAAVPGAAPAEPPVYRIKLMEEAASARDRQAKADDGGKETVEEREGARITRRPLRGAFLAVVLDGSAGMKAPAGEASFAELDAGLRAFLERAPSWLTVSVRTMGGEAGERNVCQGSKLILPPGKPGRSPDGFTPEGRRDISRALYLAAGDLAVERGRKGLVVLTGGEEECGEWPCETAQALFQTREAIRTWGLRMLARPGGGEQAVPLSGEEAAAPAGGEEFTPAQFEAPPGDAAEEAAPAPEAPPAPVSEPAPAPETALPPSALECLDRVGGGFFRTVGYREELAAALERVTAELSRNVTVRLFQGVEHELKGVNDPLMAPWKVDVFSLNGTLEGTLTSLSLPAQLALPVGRYRVTGTYGEAQAVLSDLEVAAGDEVEIRLVLGTGQVVFLEGKRGWPAREGACSPEIRVGPEADPLAPEAVLGPDTTKCGLPSQFVLTPGEYRVTVSDEGLEPRALSLIVTAGRSTVVRLDPREAPEILGVDKGGGQN